MKSLIVASALFAIGGLTDSDLIKARDRQDKAALEKMVTELKATADKDQKDAAAQYRLALAESYSAEVAIETRDKAAAWNAAQAGIDAAERAVSLKPDSSEYQRLLGTLCGQMISGNGLAGLKYGKCALTSVNKAIELDPKSSINYLSHGVGNYYLPPALGGGYELAIKDFQKAIELNAKNADAYLWMGVALRKMNQPEEARKAIAKSLELNPNRVWAKQQLDKTPGQLMRDRVAIGAAIIALTLLSYFEFPGHTYLGSDTQIYVPMLEHIWDPSSLTRDLVAPKPHLSYTLYDEIAIALRWLTHSSFQTVLIAQQLLFRAVQILGVYLLALSFPLARGKALLVAALFTLGATIAGPAVLTFEYEPVPRAFAVGLLFLAVGLVAQGHLMWADIAAAIAFLYHPPTVWVFWALYLWLTLRHRDYRDLWPLVVGILLLFVSSRLQAGAVEEQTFFTRVGPELEKLQRLRAAYNWISTWPAHLIWQYVLLWMASLFAIWRIRPSAARLFVIGMPAVGILSIPASYILLDQLKWGLIPQFQPARAVLFVTAFAVILGAAAGIRAAERRRWMESVLWFVIVLAVPTSTYISSISWRNLLLLFALAAALCATLALQRLRFAPVLLAGIAITPFFALPYLAHVRNYPRLNLVGVEDLAQFARARTSKDAVFLVGDAGTSPDPSVFRAVSIRAVYVDWKSGGQMNFSQPLAEEWWQRWQNTNALHFDPSEVGRLPGLGIDYLVLSTTHRLLDRQPAYENSQFVVYRP